VLIIRESQLARFRAIRIKRFVEQMLRYLLAEYPVHCRAMKRSQLREFVHRSIEAATAMGIDTEGATGVLTELRLVYGENFERAPDRLWIRNILAHRRLPGYIKIEAVQNRLSEKTGGRTLVLFPPPG